MAWINATAACHFPCRPRAAVSSEDGEYMRMSVHLARRALGKTSPNPMVGCVIVKDGDIVGRGFHPRAGEPHAEVFALREAAQSSVGATAYVSLEPCNHFGRTPPCSQALVRAKVKRVVVGSVDPNPLVAGQGIKTLLNAGIQVDVGVEEQACRDLNEAFFHRIVTKKPFVCLRYYMSLDGAFLGAPSSLRPEQDSIYSQQLQEYDVVVIRQAAVASGNPVLLSSEPDAKQPLRIVLATSLLDLDLEAHVFDTSVAPTLVLADETVLSKDVELSSRRYGGQSVETMLRRKNVEFIAVKTLELDTVLDLCYQRGACSVLLDSREGEPDSSLGRQAMQENVVQKLCVVVAPVVVGGQGFSGFGTAALERLASRKCGETIVLEGSLCKQVAVVAAI